MQLRSFFLVATFLLAPAFAQERTYVMKDESHLKATVLEVKGDIVKLRVSGQGGSYEVAKAIGDFSPHSGFIILRDATPASDIEGRLRVAQFAAEHGLIAAARTTLRQAREARDAAGSKAFPPEIERDMREKAVQIVEKLFQQMVAEGKTGEARTLLGQLFTRFGEKLSDEQKERLIAAVESKEAEKKTKATAAKPVTVDVGKKVKPIEDKIARGKESERKGLVNTKTLSQSKNYFEQAVKTLESAIKDTDSLAKKHAGEPEVLDTLASLRTEAENHIKSSLLSTGSVELMRGDYNDAMRAVNRVLAIDPNDGRALDMRARIEIAASEGGSYGTVVR